MITGAKAGDVILLELTNHMTRRIELVEVKTHGIEGKMLSIKKKPLRFFPWHNIISVELEK